MGKKGTFSLSWEANLALKLHMIKKTEAEKIGE